MSRADITRHEGSKYLKRIYSPVEKHDDRPDCILVDVYAVLEAFNVTCPGVQHCIKKLLMPGQRGKGNVMADLVGAMAALNRAIDLEDIRDGMPRDHRIDLKQALAQQAKLRAESGIEAPPQLSEFERLKADADAARKKTEEKLAKVQETAADEGVQVGLDAEDANDLLGIAPDPEDEEVAPYEERGICDNCHHSRQDYTDDEPLTCTHPDTADNDDDRIVDRVDTCGRFEWPPEDAADVEDQS